MTTIFCCIEAAPSQDMGVDKNMVRRAKRDRGETGEIGCKVGHYQVPAGKTSQLQKQIDSEPHKASGAIPWLVVADPTSWYGDS